MNQYLIQISENIIIDRSDIAMCKRVRQNKLGDMGQITKDYEIGVEIVLHGDRQIYQYFGSAGDILWAAICDIAMPLYEEQKAGPR